MFVTQEIREDFLEEVATAVNLYGCMELDPREV